MRRKVDSGIFNRLNGSKEMVAVFFPLMETVFCHKILERRFSGGYIKGVTRELDMENRLHAVPDDFVVISVVLSRFLMVFKANGFDLFP